MDGLRSIDVESSSGHSKMLSYQDKITAVVWTEDILKAPNCDVKNMATLDQLSIDKHIKAVEVFGRILEVDTL